MIKTYTFKPLTMLFSNFILNCTKKRKFSSIMKCYIIFLLAVLFGYISPLMADGEVDSVKQEVVDSQALKVEKATTTPTTSKANAQVYTFELNEAIFPSAWRKVKKAVEEAESKNVDFIVMKLNTYGGAVDMADSIRTKLMKAKPTTVVLIDNNAASAGALISLACDSIFMVKGAQIGAATVVNQQGTQMPDKYQSYMRATMRSTAEAQGRDPQIAEAMVDDRIHIPGIIDSAKTLTFTTTEALKHGYCDGIFANTTDVVKHLSTNAQVTTYKADWMEPILNFLLNPMVSSLLMLVIFLGIYTEVQSPGVGFPILASAIAATLYFAPNYLEGLAQHWEILLFLVGLALIAIEIFIIPGTGLAGIIGLVALVGGLTLSMVRNDFFDFTLSAPGDITGALTQVLLTIIGSGALAVALGGRFMETSLFQKMVLEDTQDAEEGYTVKSKEYEVLVNRIGLAVTDLRISGKIEIDDERYEVITTGNYIDAGTKVIVKEYTESNLIVRELREGDEEKSPNNTE